MIADGLAVSFDSAGRYIENLGPANQFSYIPRPIDIPTSSGGDLKELDLEEMERKIDAALSSGQRANSFTIQLPNSQLRGIIQATASDNIN